VIIELNYLIAAIAFSSSALLHRRGDVYRDASYFMFFFAFAALLGGIHHHLELHLAAFSEWIGSINQALPSFVAPLQDNLIMERLWFVTILSIGFAEFYFMYLFLHPIVDSSTKFILLWLKIALGIFCLLCFFSTEYLLVVVFHLVSHAIIFLFSLYLYITRRTRSMLLLMGLLVYNVSIGLMQQLMAKGVISTGSLHYNDWYHFGVIIFLVLLHLLFTRGKFIENLKATTLHRN